MTASGSSGTLWRRWLAAGLVVLAVASVEARATVLLDTFAPGNGTPGNNYHLNNGAIEGVVTQPGIGQSLAVQFSTATAVTVDSLLAAISGTGDVTLGIMADASGVPSNVYLHSTVLSDPTANASLAGLGWALAAGDYWLAAIGVHPYDGHWRGGNVDVDFAFTRESGSVTDWVHFTTDLPGFAAPAARISADSATAPEPGTGLLFGTALLVVGLGRRGTS